MQVSVCILRINVTESNMGKTLALMAVVIISVYIIERMEYDRTKNDW